MGSGRDPGLGRIGGFAAAAGSVAAEHTLLTPLLLLLWSVCVGAGIEVDEEIVLMTTKGEAVAVAIAQVRCCAAVLLQAGQAGVCHAMRSRQQSDMLVGCRQFVSPPAHLLLLCLPWPACLLLHCLPSLPALLHR